MNSAKIMFAVSRDGRTDAFIVKGADGKYHEVMISDYFLLQEKITREWIFEHIEDFKGLEITISVINNKLFIQDIED